jgi:exonuclease VII large subunit
LKQLVEAAVQEALRGTLPHLQASMRQVDDAERRRVAALEQQLADVKQQLSESISMVSSMRVQPPPSRSSRLLAREQQAVDAQLAEALRLSREEAKRAEAKAVADKIRASREEAAKQAAEAAARARSGAQASPLSAAAPLFESLIVNRDGAGSATVDIGALLSRGGRFVGRESAAAVCASLLAAPERPGRC